MRKEIKTKVLQIDKQAITSFGAVLLLKTNENSC